jgi:hypothetical protein
MTCKYEYNGLTFNSELELDEYLLFHSKRKSKLGDSVFKKSEQATWSEEQNIIHDKLDKARLQFEKGENTNKIKIEAEEGEPTDLDPVKAFGDYKSITDIIHALRN